MSKNDGASVFKTQNKPDGTTHEYFNRSGDGADHGHRVTESDTGKTVYVRDNEGTTYEKPDSEK